MAVPGEREVIEICSSEDENQELQVQNADGKHFLKKFISVCEPLLKPNQLKAITKLLFDKFAEANTEYTQSEEFCRCIDQHISDLKVKQKSVYVHIQDVKTVLMRMSTNRVKLTSSTADKKPRLEPRVKKELVEKDIDKQDEDGCNDKNQAHSGEAGETCPEDAPSLSLMMTCETTSDDNVAEDSEDEGGERVDDKRGSDPAGRSLDAAAGPSIGLNGAEHGTNKPVNADGEEKEKAKGKGSKKQIRKLEKILSQLDRAIKKLQERELTLDEMDESDSTHIQEYQLRKRFVKVYDMLCKLNDCSPSTGRVMEQKIRYEGTRFPEINKRLERLVNKKDFFPDFHDVYTAVCKTNKKKNLGLEKRKLKSIAEEAFEDIGVKLQKRRQQDFILNFSSHSTLNFVAAKDSADMDTELQKKLAENKEIAKKNLKEVEENFVRRQEQCEKSGINLEASEHSEIDIPSDGNCSDEGGDVSETSAKRRKIDQGEDLTNKDGKDRSERDADAEDQSVDTRERDEMDNQVDEQDTQCLELVLATTKPPPINKQLENWDVKTDPPVQNSLQSSVPYSSSHINGNSSVIPRNGSNSNSSTNNWSENTLILRHDPFEPVSKTLGFKRSLPLPPLVQSAQSSEPSFAFHHSASPVTFIAESPNPSPEMPLVITDVCSLSSRAGFPMGSNHKSMNGHFATLAEVIEDGRPRDGIVIGTASKQQIMVVKTSKSVQLQTSSPITLKFENSEFHSSIKRSKVNVAPTPSPPPSVTSTQPELDVSPDVEEVIMATTQSSHVWCREERLSKSTTAAQPLTQQVSCTQHRSRTCTTQMQQVKVSETAELVRCNLCRQSWRNTQFSRHVCAQSTRATCGIPSRATTSQSRYTVSNSVRHPFLGPQTAQSRVFSLKHTNNIPNCKTGTKWMLQSRQHASTTTTEIPCPRKPNSTQITSATGADNESDSDVVILSDSDLEVSQENGNPAESPDVICISDSD